MINVKTLLQAFRKLDMIPQNNIIPYLEKVFFFTKNNYTYISYTNLQITLTIKLEYNLAIEGCCSLKPLIALLSNFTEEEVKIKINKQSLIVEGKSSVYKTAFSVEEDYPKPAKLAGTPITLFTKEMLESISKLEPYLATDKNHLSNLHLLHFNLNANSEVVATNGFVLGIYKPKLNVKKDFKFNLSKNIVSILKKLNVDLNLYSNGFGDRDHTITFQQFDEKFVIYEAVLPKELPSSISVDSNELSNLLKIAAVYTDPTPKNDIVSLIPEENQLILKTSWEERNYESEAVLSCTNSNFLFPVHFRINYIKLIIKTLNLEEEFILKGIAPNKPFIAENSEFYTLIMPYLN